ncbi:AAA family ATPase [Saccharothrix obliqua]|uniref:AAA family ATPase n=1 Tax=Saccharothrix obliqua TaxID=2861747 RepID=UPI001C600CD1|nr:AAA family ATPase [Saccharothrix obliqua]MBW4721602.1 ATP-binding protein [Saccharothrix obliqua]
MRIAFVGAYGNGKTTLTTELSARLGLGRTHGSAMRNPAGGAPKPLEETTESELIQLAARRFIERSVEESSLKNGFLSDGSVLHEWVYTKVRLAVGRYPEPAADVKTAVRSGNTGIYEEVVDQLSLLAQEHARTGYDLFVHCPVEVPLAVDPLPISESFRVLSDKLMLETLGKLGLPVHVVTGSVEERISQVLALPNVPSPH